MADNLKKRSPQDRERINLSEAWEVDYWCKKFGVSGDQLKAAVKAVGPMTKEVRRSFANDKPRELRCGRAKKLTTQLAPQLETVFAQIRTLHRSIVTLEEVAGYHSLRGHQTVDDDECIDISFESLHAAIRSMEQTLTLFAEAMGEIRKL